MIRWLIVEQPWTAKAFVFGVSFLILARFIGISL